MASSSARTQAGIEAVAHGDGAEEEAEAEERAVRDLQRGARHPHGVQMQQGAPGPRQYDALSTRVVVLIGEGSRTGRPRPRWLPETGAVRAAATLPYVDCRRPSELLHRLEVLPCRRCLPAAPRFSSPHLQAPALFSAASSETHCPAIAGVQQGPVSSPSATGTPRFVAAFPCLVRHRSREHLHRFAQVVLRLEDLLAPVVLPVKSNSDLACLLSADPYAQEL